MVRLFYRNTQAAAAMKIIRKCFHIESYRESLYVDGVYGYVHRVYVSMPRSTLSRVLWCWHSAGMKDI